MAADLCLLNSVDLPQLNSQRTQRLIAYYTNYAPHTVSTCSLNCGPRTVEGLVLSYMRPYIPATNSISFVCRTIPALMAGKHARPVAWTTYFPISSLPALNIAGMLQVLALPTGG